MLQTIGGGSVDKGKFLQKEWPLSASKLRVVNVDKLSSVAARANLGDEVTVSLDTSRGRVGDLVAVRVVSVNPAYNVLELATGRMARLSSGDVVVGALGARRALKGFVGDVPDDLVVGDQLHILNMGGVIGRCTGHHQAIGAPLAVELLGVVVDDARPVNLADHALPWLVEVERMPPVVAIAGSCMHAGKTRAASELVRAFVDSGARVAAAKLSGVACMKDTLEMRDHGAFTALSFADFGLPSTVGCGDLGPLTRAIFGHLAAQRPDIIVAELGDGLLGGYNVASILDDAALRASLAALVFCANDFVSAWGGIELLRRQGLTPDVISGPATDSRMGVDYIRQTLKTPAANALNSARHLFAIVHGRVEAKRHASAPAASIGATRL